MTESHGRLAGRGSEIAARASAERPCPTCGSGSKGCSATADGLHLCRGEPGPDWREVGRGPDSAGFRHFRRADDRPPSRPTPVNRQLRVVDWAGENARLAGRLTPDARTQLAADLGLPADALATLAVGLAQAGGGPAFTFPECDAAGRVVGIVCRLPGGEKRMIKGGRRGLTLPAGWQARPGPVYVVEGASDALALTAAGLAGVGRPSNAGGADELTKLLIGQPADRPVTVVGENDEKPTGLWPGRDGAGAVARKLAAALGRPVRIAYPPAGAKDVRDWLTHPARAATDWSARGRELAAHLDAAAHAPPAPPVRAAVRIGEDEGRVNDEAVAAVAADPTLFRQAGVLVTVVETEDDRPAVQPVSVYGLRERLSRRVEFLRVRTTENGLVSEPAHPPDWCAKAILARAGDWPGVRPLRGTADHPVLRPDGSVLAARGYDPATGLFVSVPADLTLTVPDRPTRDDVTAAADLVLSLVADFPFAAPAHRAAWLAALLTPPAWHLFAGPAPLFLFDANVPAAGKGKLADVIQLALVGRMFAVAAYKADEDELRKTITALAAAGGGPVMFDNISGPVGNGTLDAALTAVRWEDRILCHTAMFRGPLNVIWYATGNNVQLQADTARRVCHVRLESADEHPERRTDFRYPKLLEHVQRHRPAILSAVLTLLRGWHVAGRPVPAGLTAWGSYEGWSAVVRACVVWLGLPDPGDTREVLRATADTTAPAMRVILAAWQDADSRHRGLTAAGFVGWLSAAGTARAADGLVAVEELCGKVCGRALAYKLKHFQRRNFGGLGIDKAGADGSNTMRSKVIRFGPPGGTDPTAPTPPPPAPPDDPDPGYFVYGNNEHRGVPGLDPAGDR